MNQNVTIHTDGACAGNPGPGGFGAVATIGGKDYLTVIGGSPHTTNNRMELTAVIQGIRAVNQEAELRDSPITVRSDSTYVVKAFNNDWIDNWQRNGWINSKRKPVPNQDLWNELLQAIGHHQVTWEWVKGHSGDPMNERCDRLATNAIDEAETHERFWVSCSYHTLSVPDEPPVASPHGELEDWVAVLRATWAETTFFDEFRHVMIEQLEQGEP